MKVGDTGIFIGELTSPFIGGKLFYENSVKTLFEKYKEKMALSGVKFNKADSKLFYTPSGYCMMGNYDLAVISLIEDFHFSNRHFHPYSFLNNESTGFNYHLNTGSACQEKGDYLSLKAKDTFLKKGDRYPFIGISNYKIKNSLLLGSGYKVVQLAVSALNKLLNEFKEKCENTPDNFDFIVYESVSWNEIGVIYFSNNYKSVADAILLSREINVQYGFDSLMLDDMKVEYKKSILNGSLLSKDMPLERKEQVILGSHLFTHTYSNLGVDIQWLSLYDKANKLETVKYKGFFPAILSKEFTGFIRWFVKPYHLGKFLKSKEIDNKNELKESNDFYLIVGNGDIGETDSDKATLSSVLTKLKKFHIESSAKKKGLSAIRKTKTIPKFLYTKKYVNKLLNVYNLPRLDPSYEYSFSVNKLKGYAFTPTELSILRRELIQLKVSKTLRERILNAFINYNDGIQDPILYTGFIEFRDYLRYIQQRIKEEVLHAVNAGNSSFDADTRHAKYNKLIEDYYNAYETQMLHSYRLYSVTDFNLDYNGGIQPILSGYDSAFKYVRDHFNFDSVSSSLNLKPYICVVSGMPGITSTSNNIRINYNHLFSPEFFFAALNKEAINHFFTLRTLHRINGMDTSVKVLLKKAAYYYRANNFEDGNKLISQLPLEIITPLETFLYLIENSHEQLIGEFKKELLKKITPITDRKTKALMLEYIETVNAGTFYYFLEDFFCAKILTYERYRNWIWILYAQESEAYNYNLTLNEPKLYRMLLRTSVLASTAQDKLSDFFERFSTTHASQGKYHWETMSHFSSLLLETDVIPGLSAGKLFDSVRDIVEEMEVRYIPVTNEMDEVDIKNARTARAKHFRENLSVGNITALQVDSFDDLIHLITAYLDEVEKMIPKENMVLERDVDSGEQCFQDGLYIHSELTEAIMLDPTGGVYTIGCNTRRKYFLLRQTMIKALFDFSLKQKHSHF